MSEFIKFRNLDVDGDWCFGKGLQDYADNIQSTMLNIKTRLQSFKYDCFFDLDAGIDWLGILGRRGGDIIDLIELQIRCCILDSLYVTGISDFDIIYNERNRSLTINYVIDTMFGQASDTTEVGGING